MPGLHSLNLRCLSGLFRINTIRKSTRGGEGSFQKCLSCHYADDLLECTREVRCVFLLWVLYLHTRWTWGKACGHICVFTCVLWRIYFYMAVLCLALKCYRSGCEEVVFFYTKWIRKLEQWHFPPQLNQSRLWKKAFCRWSVEMIARTEEEKLECKYQGGKWVSFPFTVTRVEEGLGLRIGGIFIWESL